MNARSTAKVASVLALVAASGLLLGGPLNPPAGAVSSSMKTLAEVEPRVAINAANTPGDLDSLFRITQPGSYYLTGNLTGVAAKHGIEVAASGVTIDLNGFKLVGVGGSHSGVAVTAAGIESLTVKNGTVSNWGANGIDTVTAEATGSLIQDVSATHNSGNGIRLFRYGRAINCISDWNGAYGFDSYMNCTVTGCSASNNASNGIDAAGNSMIADCVCNSNGNIGIDVNSGSKITGCVANLNGMSGIRVTDGCLVSGNVSTNNSQVNNGYGVLMTGSDNRAEGNSCNSNQYGIGATGPGNVIIRNTCGGNAQNWAIVANNIYGTIVDKTGQVSAAVGSNSAASSLGTTDANANFSH